MKLKFMRRSVFYLSVSLFLLSCGLVHAQKQTHDEVAIYEPGFEYLQTATSSFVVQYSFDPTSFVFKETSQKTMLWLTPDCNKRKIVKTLPKGSLVKAYKFFPETEVYAVQYENNWGFTYAHDLTSSQKYKKPIPGQNLDLPPLLLNTISTKYPLNAKQAGIMGDVVVKVHISNTGAVSQILIEKSIPQLDSAAIRAVQRLRFKPAKKYGSPVDVWIRFPVQFRLKK